LHGNLWNRTAFIDPPPELPSVATAVPDTFDSREACFPAPEYGSPGDAKRDL
jgi:hypothetical protein